LTKRYNIPEKNRIVVLERKGKIQLKEVPIKHPEKGWDLIKVGACGICGSDVRYFLGENPWALHTLGINEEMPANSVLGHEVAGTIVEVGDPENKDRLGERVGIIAFNTCKKCYHCRHGMHNLCENTLHIGHDGRWKDWEYNPGGYADYMLIWDDKAHHIPDNISFIEATQLDGLAVAVHANNRGNVKPGDNVLVIGLGAIGLMLSQVAYTRGAIKVIGADIHEKPLEIAEKIGVDVLINSRKDDLLKIVMKETKGIGANVVFDTVGSAESFLKGMNALARGGTYVLLAVSQEEVKIPLTLFAGEKVVTTSANNLFPEYTTAVELLSSGRVKVKPFITHVFKLSEVYEAFKVAVNKDEYEAIKVVLVPD